jgi:hypothetical protein
MHDNSTPTAAVRLELDGRILDAIEDWRRLQSPKIPPRREAVRRLLELGLSQARVAASAS